MQQGWISVPTHVSKCWIRGKRKRVLLKSFVVVPHPPARERAHAHTHHRFMDPKLVADYLTATANASGS